MHPGKQSAWPSGAWRPDTRASLGMALAATLAVMAGFAALFSAVTPFTLSQSALSVREELVFAEPTPVPPQPRHHVRAARPTLPVQLPELQRMPPPVPLRAPDSFSLQDYLDERAKGGAAALRDQVTSSELRRDMGKAVDKQALPDNQSYRTVDGQKVVRTGGGCAQIQTVQGSSSPTNRINLAEPTGCPGGTPDASQEMGKALDDWAKKVQQPHPPP